jgi:hypothetical protein
MLFSRSLRSSSASLTSSFSISTSALSLGSGCTSSTTLWRRIRNSSVTAPKPHAMMSKKDRLKAVNRRFLIIADPDQFQLVAPDTNGLAGPAALR